jgi:hypothetical protein
MRKSKFLFLLFLLFLLFINTALNILNNDKILLNDKLINNITSTANHHILSHRMSIYSLKKNKKVLGK